jgi:hydrogenase/urease accessory protein HupE
LKTWSVPFFVHLLLSPGDLLGVLAVALLAGIGGAQEGRWSAVILPAACLGAGLLGLQLGPGVSLPWLSVLSLVVLGAMVAANVRLPAVAAATVALLFGSLHGLMDGAALSALGAGLPSLFGIVTTVLAIALLGSALVVSLQQDWSRIAVRVVGSWVAAVGILMTGWLLQATS